MSVSLPSRNIPGRWVEIALLVVLALVLLPFLFPAYFHGDELSDLSFGLSMLHGEIIYRDTYSILAPLTSLIAYGTFAVVGPWLWAGRIVQIGVIFLCGWQIYRLSRRLEVPAWAATMPALALVVGLYRAWPGYSHHWLAMPFMLGAIQSAFIAMDRASIRFWALAGAATGLLILTMQSDGVVVAFCLLVVALAGC
jgi:hypothetical protein